MKDPFEAWLEQQLAEGFARQGRRPVRPFSTGRLPRLGLALPAALSAKAVAGLAVAALAAGGGAVLVKTIDPTAFGPSVKTQATTICPQGTGHGACVSGYARSQNPGARHRSSNALPGAGGQGSQPGQGANPHTTHAAAPATAPTTPPVTPGSNRGKP